MILFRDVIYQVVGKGQGCPLISYKTITYNGIVPQAMGKRGGGGGGTQTVTQNTTPWAGQQPFLLDIFGQAQKNFQGIKDAQGNVIPTPGFGPGQFYPGQTYAGFDPLTEAALGKTTERALAGSPVQNAANEQLMKTLYGEYLPYEGTHDEDFNKAYGAARDTILPDIQSRYAQGGRYGSGLAREAEAKGLGNAFAAEKLNYNRLFQDKYQKERENQMRAMGLAPAFAESDYADLARLAGVGHAYEGQNQSAIDEAMARHAFEQMEPSERLARYMQMVQGNFGNQQTTTHPFFKGNKGAGILGGALGGANLGGQFGPWGAGIGGLLGGLTGLF